LPRSSTGRARARTASPAQNPSRLFREHLDRLSEDWQQKTQQIRVLERHAAHLLSQTPYVLLLALPGISVVTAAELAGELGPITHYANANHITGRAGLCPSRYQSDRVDLANGPLRRRANRRLRATLLRIADNLMRLNHHYRALSERWLRLGKDPRWVHVKVAKSFSRLAFVMLQGQYVLPHPACQPRHSICEKLLAFHTEHKTDMQCALEDIDRASKQLASRTRHEETQMLQRQLQEPQCRRRRGPVALAKIIPLVLARLGMRVVQSEAEGEDPD
jgi:transposase